MKEFFHWPSYFVFKLARRLNIRNPKAPINRIDLPTDASYYDYIDALYNDFGFPGTKLAKHLKVLDVLEVIGILTLIFLIVRRYNW